jgi:hypothetical protein
MQKCWQKCVGLHFGRFYDKHIWSPWNQLTVGYNSTNSRRLLKPSFQIHTGVARWYIFKQKIPIWVNFGGSYNGRCWYNLWTLHRWILRPFAIFYGYLVFFPLFWYIVLRKIWQSWSTRSKARSQSYDRELQRRLCKLFTT